MESRQSHWEKVYATRQAHEVSWTQEVPGTSLAIIGHLNLPKSCSIIDIGGGDSRLVDFLLAAGYEDITVLDISRKAIGRAQKRLGTNAEKVTWIVSDILDFVPERTYDLWHDRATFHFLTTPQQVQTYTSLAARAVRQYLIIGTFSENGPEKCSGLPVRQYSEKNLLETFAKDFDKIECIRVDHLTPFGSLQNFVFCSFEKHKAGDES